MVIITFIAAAVIILALGLFFFLANGTRIPNARMDLPERKLRRRLWHREQHQ